MYNLNDLIDIFVHLNNECLNIDDMSIVRKCLAKTHIGIEIDEVKTRQIQANTALYRKIYHIYDKESELYIQFNGINTHGTISLHDYHYVRYDICKHDLYVIDDSKDHINDYLYDIFNDNIKNIYKLYENYFNSNKLDDVLNINSTSHKFEIIYDYRKDFLNVQNKSIVCRITNIADNTYEDIIVLGEYYKDLDLFFVNDIQFTKIQKMTSCDYSKTRDGYDLRFN